MSDDVYCLQFMTSQGVLWDVDWRDIELLQDRDPEGRTVPGPNVDELLLTADDCVLLWSMRIGS